MAFQSPLVARERILLYGEPGTGKSHAIVQLAKFMMSASPTTNFYVIDNDRSYKLTQEINSLSNMAVKEVYDFPEYREALDTFLRLIKPNDFLVCDLMSESWSAAQTYYTDQVHDNEANYFLQVRAAMKSPTKENVLDGWTDWQYINRIYFNFAKPFVYKSPCHIIATSTADPVARPKPGSTVGDDRETLTVFGSVGWKPEGQKRLKHQFNTTIFVFKDNRGVHRFTTVKDRERPLIIAQPLNSFPIDYLKSIAKWVIS